VLDTDNHKQQLTDQEVHNILSGLSAAGIINVAKLHDGQTWCLPQPQQLQLLKLSAPLESVVSYHAKVLDQGYNIGSYFDVENDGEGKKEEAEEEEEEENNNKNKNKKDVMQLPDDGYIIQQLAYHLEGAGRLSTLRQILLDPGYLERKLYVSSTAGVVADFRRYLMTSALHNMPPDQDVKLALEAFQMSAGSVLAHPELAPGLLRCMMAGRLMAAAAAQSASEMKMWLAKQLESVDASTRTKDDHHHHHHQQQQQQQHARPVSLVPLTPSLDQAGGLQRLALRGHQGSITKLLLCPSGTEFISCSTDGTACIWDMEIGDCTLTIGGATEGEDGTTRYSGEAVTDIALTDDSSLLVMATGNVIKAYETEQGQCLRILGGQHQHGRVTCIALDPIGRFVCSGGEDGRVIVWDLTSSQPYHKLTPPGGASLAPGGVRCLTLSACGQFLWAGYAGGDAVLYGLVSGKVLGQLKGEIESGWLTQIVMSRDGKRGLTVCRNKCKVWDLTTGTALFDLCHSGRITEVKLSPSHDNLAVTASEDGTAKIWDITNGSCRAVLKGHQAAINALDISSVGDRVLTAAADGAVIAFSLETGDIIRMVEGHPNSVQSVLMTRKGRFAVIGGEDGACRVYDLAASPTYIPNWHHGRIHSLDGSQVEAQVATAGADGVVRLWDTRSGEFRRVLNNHASPVRWVVFSSSLPTVCTASGDHCVKVWNLANGATIHELPAKAGSRLKSFAASGDLSTAVLCFFDGCVSIWDLSSQSCLVELQKRGQRDAAIGHSSAINKVLMTRDGSKVITLSKDATARVWDAHTGNCLFIFTGHAESITGGCLDQATNTMLLTYCFDENACRVWSLETGMCTKVLRDIPANRPMLCTEWSADASHVAVAVQGGDVLVFSLSDGNENKAEEEAVVALPHLRIQGHTSDITALSFSPNGSLLVSCSKDCCANINRTSSGELIGAFVGDSALTSCFVDGANGRLVLGADTGTVHFVDIHLLVG
jgi:WD40 repeat protein